MSDLLELTIGQAAARIAAGELSGEEYAAAYAEAVGGRST